MRLRYFVEYINNVTVNIAKTSKAVDTANALSAKSHSVHNA